MGPQLDSCGRGAVGGRDGGGGELQWGRNLTVAEGKRSRGRPAGPKPASMGPQLDSCGRSLRQSRMNRSPSPLQWGRNLTVAEGVGVRQDVEKGKQLQWGRNLTVAEGRDVTTPLLVPPRFNGAAT